MDSFPSVSSFTAVLQQLLPEPHAGLLAGILFGTKATISPALTHALIDTGTIHMIALSGMNISIVVGVVVPLLGLVFSRRIASLLTILVLGGYVAFVGVSPSVVRAAVMGSINLFAVIVGRASWSLLTWALAVGSMLLLNPPWITDLGFQLSALASLGIILFGGTPLRHAQRGFAGQAIRFIEENFRVTLAAQALTIPVIFWYFHRIALIAPLSNLAIGWTMAPLMVLGWLAAYAGWLFIPLGQVLAWVSWALLEWIVVVVTWAEKIPFASVGW